MCAQMKAFFDATGGHWQKGALVRCTGPTALMTESTNVIQYDIICLHTCILIISWSGVKYMSCMSDDANGRGELWLHAVGLSCHWQNTLSLCGHLVVCGGTLLIKTLNSNNFYVIFIFPSNSYCCSFIHIIYSVLLCWFRFYLVNSYCLHNSDHQSNDLWSQRSISCTTPQALGPHPFILSLDLQAGKAAAVLMSTASQGSTPGPYICMSYDMHNS